MTFYKLNGYKVSKNVDKYRIKWNGPTRSKFQSTVKFQIEPYWSNHIVFEEFPVVGTRMTIDLLNLTLRVAIEVQGEQHGQKTDFFHASYIDFGNQIERDVKKQEWCNLNSIRLVEIYKGELPITKEFLLKNNLI